MNAKSLRKDRPITAREVTGRRMTVCDSEPDFSAADGSPDCAEDPQHNSHDY
jgi:hypothetical protein